jgi:hypothetical protein
MTRWAIGGAVIYLLLKLFHVAFCNRTGFGPQEFNLREAVRAGEPMILITAFLLSIIATLYPQWSNTRLGAREIGHSTICYGQLAASGRLPGIYKAFDQNAIEDYKNRYRWVAQEHAPWVKISPDTIAILLDGIQRHYDAYYADITSKRDARSIRREFEAIERCFRDEWEVHGELFNP